jgi:hypothetical protein
MVISERIVSVRRHTVGYVIAGQEYTRNQAVKLAKQGKLTNVRLVKGQDRTYLMGRGDPNLYELPMRFGTKPWAKRR